MKYGVMLSSAKSANIFSGEEASGNARANFATARLHLVDGELLSLFSLSATGQRVTLATCKNLQVLTAEAMAELFAGVAN